MNDKPQKRIVKIDFDVMTSDRFVYHMWKRLEIARPFFKKYLPTELKENLKFETLRLLPSRLVDSQGEDKTGDLFYLCDAKGGERFLLVVILEHKSYYDRYTAFQTFGYVAKVLDDMKEEPKKYENEEGKFPSPFCVVLCQHNLPQLSELLYVVKGAEDYALSAPFLRVNMQTEDFEDLRDSEPFLYLALALQRFAFRVVETTNDEELLRLFSPILELDPQDDENVGSYVCAFLAYTSWFMKRKIASFDLNNFKTRLLIMQEQQTQKRHTRTFFQELFARELPEEMNILIAKNDQLQDRLDETLTQAKRREEEFKTWTEEFKTRTEEFKKAESENLTNQRLNICLGARMFFGTTDGLSALREKLEEVDDKRLLNEIYGEMWTKENIERFVAYVNSVSAKSQKNL